MKPGCNRLAAPWAYNNNHNIDYVFIGKVHTYSLSLTSKENERILAQVSVDANELAAWLFNIYKKMFAKEDFSNLFSAMESIMDKHYSTDMQRYTRAAIVALIRVLKTTVFTDWDLVMTTFLDMVDSDRTLIVGSNSLQELNMHLALFGVWTLPVLAQGPRRIQKRSTCNYGRGATLREYSEE